MKKKSRNLTILTLTILTSLLTSLTLPIIVNAQDNYGNLLQYEWTQQGNGSSLNYMSEGPAPSTPNVLWKLKIPTLNFGSQDGDLVAFNGMVFARNASGVIAVDAFTGEIVYMIGFGGPGGPGGPPGGGGGGRVTKISDTVMVIGSDGYDIATGNKLWDGDISSSAMYIEEEKMFIDVSSSGGGAAYDASNPLEAPVLIWDLSNEFEQEYFDTYGEGLIFTLRYTTIHAVDARTGTVVWETPTTSTKAYSMAYYDGRIYSGQLDGNFVCWNATTGEHLWTFAAGSGWYFWAGKIAAYEGKIYSMNQDSNMYCFDAVTGDVLWKYKGPGVYYQGHVIVADDKVYAQTGDIEYDDPQTGADGYDEYACLNATTGEVLWTLPVGVNAPAGPHCIAYGNLYFQPATTKEQYSNGVFSRRAIGDTLYAISGKPKDWNMWRGDPTHLANGDFGPTNLAIKWKYQANGSITSSPSIVDGIVYVGSHDKNIYAIDAETGSKIWSFETDYKVHSSPAVVNGKVYTGTEDGNIYCLNAQTGDIIWQNSDPGDITWINWGALQSFTIRSSPAVVDGVVYVGSLDKNLYAIDANTGITIWKFESGGYIHSSPAVADGAVYVATATGRPAARLYKLHANNGTVIWSKMIFYQRGPGPLVPWASPTVADGMVFQSIDGFDHYGINATDGATVWKYRSFSWLVIGASPLYADGLVYIPDMFSLVAVDAKIGATNITDPNVKWATFLGREMYTSPAYASGHIYIGSQLMSIYVLDAKTGEKQSYYELGSQLISSPSVYDGKVYIGTLNWNLYCFNEAPPQIISPPTPPPTWPTAEEIAQKVKDTLPTNPTTEQITAAIMNQLPAYPEGPTAQEVAQRVIDNLPDNPTSAEIAQAVENQLDIPEPTETPEYTTIDLVLIVLVVIAIIIGLISFITSRKRD